MTQKSVSWMISVSFGGAGGFNGGDVGLLTVRKNRCRRQKEVVIIEETKN